MNPNIPVSGPLRLQQHRKPSMIDIAHPNDQRTRGDDDPAPMRAVLAAMRRLPARLGAGKGLAGILAAGGVSAVLVVAEQVVSAWANGHLLLAWIALWVLVFALLAAFADTIRNWPSALQARIDAWFRAAARRAADEQTWAAAQCDPRLMAELQAARLRAERQALANGTALPHWPFAGRPLQPVWPYARS